MDVSDLSSRALLLQEWLEQVDELGLGVGLPQGQVAARVSVLFVEALHTVVVGHTLLYHVRKHGLLPCGRRGPVLDLVCKDVVQFREQQLVVLLLHRLFVQRWEWNAALA